MSILGIWGSTEIYIYLFPPSPYQVKYILYTILGFRCDFNRIGGVMVSVFASSAVDRVVVLRSGQTKDYEIGICCFSDHVFEWRVMSTRGLFYS